MRHKKQFFWSFWAVFWPWHYKQPKKSKFWKTVKKKKKFWRYHFTLAPQMTIIWCMVPKILRATDRIFCHFGLIFALFSLLQHQQPETSKFCQKMTKKSLFCHFGLFFALIPPNNQENQIFEKMKKMPWDIIILHMCTINENYKMYGSWDMQHDRQNFFSFWTIFPPFYHYNNPEIIIAFTPEEDLWKYLTAILDVCGSLGCTSNPSNSSRVTEDINCQKVLQG